MRSVCRGGDVSDSDDGDCTSGGSGGGGCRGGGSGGGEEREKKGEREMEIIMCFLREKNIA